MKMILILLILITLYTFNLFAQWQPDVRLTYNPAASSTSFNNAWCIASSGDFVHAVWYDLRDGNREIYYKRSTDGGVSWGADTRLTNNSANSWYPSVSVSSSVVHVVWQDNRDGNEAIYYKRSTDGGLSWGTDTRLTSNSGYSLSPSGAVSGSEVHVVWYEGRDGNNEIYYKRSSDGGISWGADTRLTNDIADSYGSSVSVSGSVVHVAWQDKRDSNYEIYHKRSTDAGISWGTDTRLTNNPALSRYPSLSASGSIVHIVWEDYRGSDFNIYYKRSTDGGTSWTADIPLTLDLGDSYHPSLSVSGSVLHAVWSDNRDGNSNIYYKRSTDAGISWQADTPLTSNFATAVSVSVSVSDQVVHAVWQDNREGNYEIFYKRNPTGNSEFTLSLTVFIEGFYDSVTNNLIGDTVTVYLRNSSFPYNVIDSSKRKLSSSGTAPFLFSNAVNGISYYLEVKHRNSIATWSSFPIVFTSGSSNYNFAAVPTQAYGSNEVQVDTSPLQYAIYSGDVNQDGFVNLNDIILTSNNSSNFISGYVSTDLNGDDNTNLSDILIAYNNSNRFVSVMRP